MRVILWGTYDKGKPRTRIVRAALQKAGTEVIEIHRDVWNGIEDKSQVKGRLARIRLLMTWMAAYPWLIVRYLRAPAHDVVVLTYPGHLDVLILWPFAALRGRPIVWDAFLSLYDTVVLDRRLVAARHPLAWFLWSWEWLACRAASRVVLDTEAHARFFRDTYRLSADDVAAVLVGVEDGVFRPQSDPLPAVHQARAEKGPDVTILFYGQFIPLHGVDTIVRAARSKDGRRYRWVLIGRGQEASKIRGILEERPIPELQWIPWVPYEELAAWIDGADICLGIFGRSGKASRVIPNKVFQVLSVGKPLITRDSPAIRELFPHPTLGVCLVPPADPDALLGAVERLCADRAKIAAAGPDLHLEARRRFSLAELGRSWSSILHDAAASTAGESGTVAGAGGRSRG